MTITTDSLRKAMAPYLGSVLTPEIAAAIELAAHDGEERAHDPAKFGRVAYHDITFQAESFRAILDELHPLHEAHFAETEKHLQGQALRPNYAYMAERERIGSLIQFTARRQGQLVGNCRMYLHTSLHTGVQVAEEDTLFLLPACRRGFAALRFLRFVEASLIGIGVREIRANSKVVNQAHRLMDYMGYTHFANQYVKIFQ